VSELLAPLRRFLQERSPRERWLIVLAICALVLIGLDALVLSPLRARAERLQSEAQQLATDLLRAAQVAREVRLLNAQVAAVEARIRPGEKTNLFTLLESLATKAGVKDQLESIKPKQPSGNERFPETRVEVSLKAASLAQTVRFLHEIEASPLHLIVRSLRIKTRGDPQNLLEVSFSVSSYTRA
jgi:type II secretory pathway component PulM